MRIEVRFFGRLTESASPTPLTLDVSTGATAGTVRTRLCGEYAAAGPALRTAMVAVNAEYASDSLVLGEGDVIAFLPPVSGG